MHSIDLPGFGGVLKPDPNPDIRAISTDRSSLIAQAAALGRDILRETPVVNAVVFSDYLRCGPRWFLKQSQFMIGYPIEDQVQRLRTPVLIIRGGDDPIAGIDWCRRLKRRASRGRLVVIPGHRHVVQHTVARAVAAAIRATL